MVRLRHEIGAALKGVESPRVTVVRAGGLGDTLLLMPALQLLLKAQPRPELTLIGSAWAERLGPLIPFPFRLHRFDSPLLTPLFGPSPAQDPTGAFSGAHLVVVYAAGPDDNLIANVRHACAGTVIVWPVEPEGATHAALHFARALADLPGLQALPLPTLRVPTDLQQWSQGWLARRFPAARGARCGPQRTVVAVHPGSGSERKCWPAEHFARVIAALDAPVLLVEGPADGEPCRRLEELLPERTPLVKASSMNVAQAAALLTHCRAYVGNDSGLTHLAAALRVPTVAVFGPTDPAVWAPRGPQIQVVRATPADTGAWPDPDRVMRALTTYLT